MFFTAQELANRISMLTSSMELVGENKTVGHILVNDKRKIGVYIHNEEKLLDVMEECLTNLIQLKQNRLIEDYNDCLDYVQNS